MRTDTSADAPLWLKIVAGIITFFVMFIVLIVVVGWFVYRSNQPVDPAVAAERAAGAAATNTARACTVAVRQRLADPAGGDFPLFSMASQVQHVGTERHILESYVDTTNAFGAAVRLNYRCVVSGSGSDLAGYRVTSLEIG